MAEMRNINRKDALLPLHHKYYILLKDRLAQKHERGYGSSTSAGKTVYLLKGSILFRHHTTVDETTGLLKLHAYDKQSYFSDCPINDVEPIDEEDAKLLLSFTSIDERLKFYEDNSLTNGKKMTVGDNVYVKCRLLSGGKQEFRAIIRFKGPLPDEHGTMFGIELVDGRGRGTTNGHFKSERYFKCDPDCGMFVSLDKLRLCKDPLNEDSNTKEVNLLEDNTPSMFTKVKNKIVEGISSLMQDQQTPESSLEKPDNTSGHQINDKVWVFINDNLCGGFIKYIGRPPGERQILAGIQLDNPVGIGNGDYYNKQLFHCDMNHAHFTTLERVITHDKLDEMYGHPKDAKAARILDNSPPSIPQTSEDIVNMESKFSKQSTDQVIKEQEQLLKKIKQEEEQKTSEKRNCDCSSPGVDTSLDNYGWSKNEDQTKLNNHVPSNNYVSQATIQVNNDQRNQTPNNYPQVTNNSTPLRSNLDVGSMVEVLSKHQKPKYGLIRWIGFIPNSDKKTAGLELEEEMNACTDGTFLGKRYFTCPNRRGFFVHLHNCLPDSRFNKNSMENASSKRLTGTDFGAYESEIIEHDFTPPPETIQVYLIEGPRGIQGHHNSCYLDATLFATFAFSSVMDSILLRPRKNGDIEEYEKVQTVLRNNIIYPLRYFGFVRADRVLELRELLDKLGTVTGLVGEEKDPEEFLLTLLQQVLKSEPFLKIKSGKEVRNEYFYQVLADKDVERVLPSVEELLKKSFHQSDLKLTEVPSCLIVQMPRFGKQFKMYNRILPSLTINIGELVDNSPQDCAVCGRLAVWHCRECFTVTGSQDKDSSGNFCKDCNERVHSHIRRAKHKRQPILVTREIYQSYGNSNRPVEHREMELFAVICIETSHYVTFAKCEEPNGNVRWCFFDSMADRVGTKNGYNIPSVTECPEIIEWLSSEKVNRERIINTNDKEMPDRVRRILGDAYVCLYQSKEMAMYK